ncbi:2-phosphosulfolactate phosphatase [Humisphaera borealis]|uniref:Probable 2-phosphosulfolactate phosphatase n=1 Tax=Humisphaera borealis TaxID=2807512 RepID=A0A7M2WZQ9_9BACT|nr:2-phosphosulfolactate phosphatase [Humisphaera borealis]QOV90988.1 2-phosphosulfolactate phosphatase [Humisphaera borealis]
MKLDVVFLPADLEPSHLNQRAVGVFDVLRATTTITAALAAGVREIRLFPDVASVRDAAKAVPPNETTLLLGEEHCLAPAGFDLGNSPGALRSDLHAGRVGLMSTTNGTRAMIAARGAAVRFAVCLVNASAAARAMSSTGRDITLLCAGTGGRVALEDVVGCGAVIAAIENLNGSVTLGGDTARIARQLFLDHRDDLRALIASGDGGQNVMSVGLTDDIDYCSRLDALKVVGVVEGGEPIVRPWMPPR